MVLIAFVKEIINYCINFSRSFMTFCITSINFTLVDNFCLHDKLKNKKKFTKDT